MLKVLAVLFLNLGSINSLLAIHATTCTQGGHALGGGIITLSFYAVAASALWRAPLERWEYLWLMFSLPIAVYHSWFAMQFTFSFLLFDMSACDAIHGGLTLEKSIWEPDGSEPAYITLWLSLSLVYWLGISKPLVLKLLSKSPVK
jgi:hypothetical protein